MSQDEAPDRHAATRRSTSSSGAGGASATMAQGRSEPSNERALQLSAVEAWARVLRALAFYPPGNVRVRGAFEAFFEALAAAADASPKARAPVVVELSNTSVAAGGAEEEPVAGSDLDWLRTRLVATGVGRVELSADVGEPALLAFGERARAEAAVARREAREAKEGSGDR